MDVTWLGLGNPTSSSHVTFDINDSWLQLDLCLLTWNNLISSKPKDLHFCPNFFIKQQFNCDSRAHRGVTVWLSVARAVFNRSFWWGGATVKSWSGAAGAMCQAWQLRLTDGKAKEKFLTFYAAEEEGNGNTVYSIVFKTKSKSFFCGCQWFTCVNKCHMHVKIHHNWPFPVQSSLSAGPMVISRQWTETRQMPFIKTSKSVRLSPRTATRCVECLIRLVQANPTVTNCALLFTLITLSG